MTRVLGLALVVGLALVAGCGSTKQFPTQAKKSATTNPAPAVPTEDNVGIAETWNVPMGTHVTVTYSGGGHCTKNEKNLSFDTGAPPYGRTDTLYTRSIAGVCSVQLSSAVFVIKTSTGQTRDLSVAQTTLKGLYETRCRGGNLACRDSGGGSKTTTPRVALG
jgi:hypothetical protein